MEDFRILKTRKVRLRRLVRDLVGTLRRVEVVSELLNSHREFLIARHFLFHFTLFCKLNSKINPLKE